MGSFLFICRRQGQPNDPGREVAPPMRPQMPKLAAYRVKYPAARRRFPPAGPYSMGTGRICPSAIRANRPADSLIKTRKMPGIPGICQTTGRDLEDGND